MIECHEQYTSSSTTGRGGDRFNRCATSSRSSTQNCHDRRDFWARWSFTTITQQARLKCAIDCIRQGFGCDCSSEKNNRSAFLDHSQQLCTDESVPESIDGILLDLGISSPQVDEAHRGFSFRRDGPLDMRMNIDQGITAAEWLEQAPQEEITKVIKAYGEERFASQIAKAIVAKREEGLSPKTTLQLANLVASVVRTREPGQDPATRTFQALRIFINRELEDLEQGLKAALSLLKPGGRLAVISFHSLEDRIVKQFLQAHAKVEVPRGLPVREKDLPQSALEIIGRVRPSKEELEENPRARSAIMRVAEKRMGALA